MSTVVSIQLDRVETLAAELAALASALSDDVALCTSSATRLRACLGGDEGWHAGAAATGWAQLMELLRARSAAVAGTLSAATESYRTADAALRERIAASPWLPAPR
jgi:hypothetical protein